MNDTSDADPGTAAVTDQALTYAMSYVFMHEGLDLS